LFFGIGSADVTGDLTLTSRMSRRGGLGSVRWQLSSLAALHLGSCGRHLRCCRTPPPPLRPLRSTPHPAEPIDRYCSQTRAQSRVRRDSCSARHLPASLVRHDEDDTPLLLLVAAAPLTNAFLAPRPLFGLPFATSLASARRSSNFLGVRRLPRREETKNQGAPAGRDIAALENLAKGE